jgi:hypothetical protein
LQKTHNIYFVAKVKEEKMANKRFWLVILAMVLVFGMTVVSCDNNHDNGFDNNGGGGLGLDGTWYSYGNVYKYYFNYGYYEHTYNGNLYRKGTYTTTYDSMTMTITHISMYSLSSSYTWLEPSTWYSRDEFYTAYLNYYRATYRSQIQQTYDSLVTTYGVETANSYFQSAYGTTNIDSIADSYDDKNYGNSIDASLNQLYTSSTVAYLLSGNTLILGGTNFTRD